MGWRNDLPKEFEEWYLEKCINMLQVDRDNQLAHLRLYTIYKKKRDFDNARQHLFKIRDYDPNYKTDAILFFIADSFHRQKDYENALEYYKKSHQVTKEKFLVLL